MKVALKILLAFAVAALCMLAFRSLVFTVYIVEGHGLAPEFVRGDRVLVNRWSYGLRTGAAGSLFSYGRLFRMMPERGDIVAFDSPSAAVPGVLVCRCTAVPGDTVRTSGGPVVVPGKMTCADEDCYWMEAVGDGNATDSRLFGFVPERNIIGRVCMVIYSHDDLMPFYAGYSPDRVMIFR